MTDLQKERAKAIIGFVNEYYQKHHRSPSNRETAERLHISTSTVSLMLNEMARQDLIDYDGRTICTPFIRKLQNGVCPVGVMGSIPCGPEDDTEQPFEAYIDLPVSLVGDPDNFYLLRTHGTSMTGAGIEEDDLLLIRRTKHARFGEIIVAWVEGRGNTLKRLMKGSQGIYLHPENKKMKDIPVKPEELRVQGVVEWIFKKADRETYFRKMGIAPID